MTPSQINVDTIFEKILEPITDNDDDRIEDLSCLDKIIFKNFTTKEKRCLRSYENFKKLIFTMTNENTEPKNFENRTHRKCKTLVEKTTKHYFFNLNNDNRDNIDIDAGSSTTANYHNWSVHANYLTMKIRPFVLLKHYEMISDHFNFEKFVLNGDANHCEPAGAYVYWPNVTVSFFGWRMFIMMKTNIDIGIYIPIIGNRHLGNVNLFVFDTEYFINVELAMSANGSNLFVNGNTSGNENYSPADHDDLFVVNMTNGNKGACKIIDKLVYSKKDIFEYITDDIQLESCEINEKYANFLCIDPNHMRTFEDKRQSCSSDGGLDMNRLSIKCQQDRINVITPSSEEGNFIKKSVRDAVAKISDNMEEALASMDGVGGDVLVRYFDESDFVNFDYIIIVVWNYVRKERKFEYCETDIKLYMELLCETLFGQRPGLMERALDCCKPYFQLTKTVYKKFCAGLTFFVNACIELAHFYAVHYMIHAKQIELNRDEDRLWTYSIENAIQCGINPEILCNGFIKKITIQNTHSVFNGKHYTVMKKDDELFKVTDKQPAYNVSNLKFNNWKYLYLTEQGVFNVIKMKYHDSCPFIVGNCLIKSFVNRDENEFAPKSIINYMLSNIENEIPVLKAYHVAKVAREMKILKKNVLMTSTFDNCSHCKINERMELNRLFREIWNMDQCEFVMLGIYLNLYKMHDLRINMAQCGECNAPLNSNLQCNCISGRVSIDLRAFKLALVYNLFFENNYTIIEMAWSLMYTIKSYSDTVKYVFEASDDNGLVSSYVDRIQRNREEIVNRLYDKFDRSDYIFDIIDRGNDVNYIIRDFFDENSSTTSEDNDTDTLRPHYAPVYMNSFFDHFYETLNLLKKWGVWWDKLIVARPNDDLSKWLARFYMRIIMSKVDTSDVSSYVLRALVQGYLYFRLFTNFNVTNSLVMMHFTASLAIPSDYEKMCIYLNGESNCGKSSFFDLLDTIIVAHKRDSMSYNTSKKETDEMEANKLISQLYVINEMKECNDAFFKNSADSSKSNSVCRKYEGSQKYEANYKLLIVNNKPLCIQDYDKGVRNRFCVVYMKHVFVENLKFNGSVYDHYRSARYPMEKGYYENLKNGVRVFAAHILKYMRNPRDGYVYYKNIIINDPTHNHNLACLDLNNHPFSALVYMLKVQERPGSFIEENHLNAVMEDAMPHIEKFCHVLLKKSYNEHKLLAEFKTVYAKHYRPDEKVYVGLSMVRHSRDFNLNIPSFKC